MHRTLNRSTNVVLIIAYGIALAAMLWLYREDAVIPMAAGGVIGLLAGLCQGLAIASDPRSFAQTRSAVDVRRQLMSSAFGRTSIALLWIGAALIAWLVWNLSRAHLLGTLSAGYVALMLVREVAAFPFLRRIETSDEPEAPGWNAIDAALAPVYGEVAPPFHYAPAVQAILGGPDPLDGISVYRSAAFGTNHWHFVTYGFSELYAKETEDPETSGYGFELTFRLVQAESETQPPAWALNLLQNIARYVFSTGKVFERGHYMNLNSPIAAGSPTPIRAIVFSHDPELPPGIDTANGSLSFLQVVGVTLDEMAAIRRWDAKKFLELFQERIPGGLTDLDRQSILSDPALMARVTAAIQTDGSSTGVLFPSVASFRQSEGLNIVLGANGVRDVLEIFPGRLPFQRDLAIFAGDTIIRLMPASEPGWNISGRTLEMSISPELSAELPSVLRPLAGDYVFSSMPGLVVTVERSAIKDSDGNVVEWIG